MAQVPKYNKALKETLGQPRVRRRVAAKTVNFRPKTTSTTLLLIREAKKAYALKILKSLQVDFKTKRNKYISQKQIKNLIKQIS